MSDPNQQLPAGRSRGRARVATGPTPAPQQPPPIQPGSLTTPRPPQGDQVQITNIPPAEPGRGRGVTTEGTSSSGTPSSGTKPSVSPTGGSSEESPPGSQQHSPPDSRPAAQSGAGRAALRGLPHQPAVNVRVAGGLPNIERLNIEGQGAGQSVAERSRIESVPLMKPPSCTEKSGTQGNPVQIYCNYFGVINQPDWILYQYHVDFAPVVDSKRTRLFLMKPHDGLFRNKAFDGSTIYTLTKLHDEITEVSSTTESGEIITIKIKRVGEIVSTSPQFVHLFNVVFRKCLKLYGMREIDRNYYDMNARQNIPAYNLDLINGFSTSVAVYENQLLLCAELTHKLLHKTTVYGRMTEIYNNSRGSVEVFRERCVQEIVGRIVMTSYNDNTFKVDDIAWEDTPNCTFERNGQQITFREYYRQQYNLNIPDDDIRQPLLISLPTKKDIRRGRTLPHRLVPMFCVLTGVDEAMRTDFRFKKAVEQWTKFGPNDRCRKLTDFVTKFNQNEKVHAELDKWQIGFGHHPAEIKGRMLPPETLKFGLNAIRQLDFKADWGNDMKGLKLLNSIPLKNWIVICPSKSGSAIEKFLKHYGDVINGMGILADEPISIPAFNDNPETLVKLLKDHIKDGITQMVVVIVTSKRKDRYDAIKRICCIEKPVPSQVITSQILDDDRKSKSVVTKVAIQMNCKLGGEIWETNIPIKDLMICGIDTYHDSASKNSSVCAFIATSNAAKTKYFSRATIQQTHQELSNNLSLTVKSSLEHYYRENKTYPEKIIIYRDGVGDGQLTAVKENEIPQIEKAFASIAPNYNPKLCFIVVKKRGNARFFAGNLNSLQNPPCGTVIDTVVTRAEWFDFYLISQHVTQGTVNPTHYNIIHDTIGLKPDHYQKLSFKLCHMYYNWPGTIRVPAPCQYAHKLAFLVGQSLHKEHHGSLADKLFFL